MFDGTNYWCKIWRKNDLCFQKWHERFNKFSPEHVRKSKNWDFDGDLLPKAKYKVYELKIYRGVLCHDNWRGIDLSVENWHKKFDKLWRKHSKCQKVALWYTTFVYFVKLFPCFILCFQGNFIMLSFCCHSEFNTQAIFFNVLIFKTIKFKNSRKT